MKTVYGIITLILFTSYIFSQSPTYLDPNAPIESRVNDLLDRMTLEEKIGQMTQADHGAVSDLEDVKTYFIGSILSGGGSDPSPENTPLDWTNLYDSFQQKALETRLGIPIIYGVDAVHGHSNVNGAVIFPHNIGLGATRNSELIESAARITAIEIAATGIDWNFAPCIAVPRDERWGRTYEGFGETPELAQLLGSASVRGLQNDSLNMPTSIVACAKHYIGDGGTVGGDDQGNVELSEAELRAIHLPGYIDAIENDVKTVMASYNSWNGVKLHGHDYLLNDVLKDELGFEGFVVSDWAAIDQIPGDYTSDVETSINAGIDMVMVPNKYHEFFNTLKTSVEQNKVSVDRIDDAVKRILRVKFELGLFESPLADRSLLSLVGSQEHRNVARQCVRESVVLLKKNDDILPVPKSNAKVLVAGEHADNIGLQCGGWSIQWQGGSGDITPGTTILEGFKKLAPDNEFIYDPEGNFDVPDADYAIVVVGEDPYAEGNGDSDDLTLRNSQINLVRKLKKMGLPVITILISGRPMIINTELHNSDALFAAWLPGTEGDGIAEIIFGDYQPTGTLPMTWQKSMAQIPQNYGDQNYDPLYPYGFGLTSFQNPESGSAPLLNSASLDESGEAIELSFSKSMDNSGNTEAQFYIQNNGVELEVTNFDLSDFDENRIIIQLSEPVLEFNNLEISYLSGNLTSADGGILNIFNNVGLIDFSNISGGSHILPGRIEAEDYTTMFGVQTEGTSDIGGGLNVGWIDDNDWLEYNCELQSTGSFIASFRVASLSSGGKMNFYTNDTKKFTIDIPVTLGWQNWETISESVDLAEGQYLIRLFAENGGFNINWFELSAVTNVENDNLSYKYNLEQNYPNPFNPVTTIQ
ncbi:MAG: glycoside hydrolase family 3 N-terminal domain-containing protein, partial [Melioribacteraceae bacterium]|nr:glycoside hydrolase family 3 N-terminal domain-containing protein [Melioribacteraceae bacterium]